MNNYIQNLNIGQYRGIKNLTIKNLREVNLIVGDNNSGKTSLLEAIYLLSSPHSFKNILRSSRLRDSLPFASITPYESFINIFPKNNDKKCISLQADGNCGKLSLEVTGIEETVIIDETDLQNSSPSVRHTLDKRLLGSEALAFLGFMKSQVASDHKELPLRFVATLRNPFYSEIKLKGINIKYLSPISHITENTFSNTLKNDDYKSICVQLSRLFDPDIEDLIYMPNDINGRAVEYIKSKTLGLMPLSTYGDGIKKVLSLANGIAEAGGGILLIDEIDTSIHYKYYADIFNFLIKASLKFNVQLFITTHSEEAIFEILKTQNYDLESPTENDIINVITFRKNKSGDIRARSMNGFEVYTNQQMFDFEVRI